MAKTLRGVVDDGTRKIPIENQFGKHICDIYMRPADVSIIDRYNALKADFGDIVKPLEGLSLKADGSAAMDEDWAVLKKVERDLMDRINALFDIEEADEIFAKRSPFSSVGGTFFCVNVLNTLGGIITEAIEEETRLSRQRMSKYLDDLPE